MDDSVNRGNFLEILDWYSSRNLVVGNVMNENASGNNKLTCPSIQKDIVIACGFETIKAIISDIGDNFFSLLVDEARDCSVKEQMTIVLRYVNNHEMVMERFVGVIHVIDTTSLALKKGIDEFFGKHGLSLSKLRGQGYDGASNMRGELNGLKTLILNENPCAMYIHFFAHQLQLVVVVVAQGNQFLCDFFEYLSMITNMVGASCKRKDEFRQIQHECLVEMLANGEVLTAKELNQEATLIRPGATRWGSHFTTIVRLLSLWPSTIEVFGNIFKDGTDLKTRGVACSLVEKIVIDRICQEMETRFGESNTELLTCIGCISPKNSFSKFDNSKIIRFAGLYPQDFSKCALMELEEELKGWIYEMRENDSFSLLQDIGDVAKKMVEAGYHTAFLLVYRVIELILVLLVATATVERSFFAMKIIKTDLHNKIGDDFLTNCLVCYIERDVFKSIDNEVIMQYFQSMKTRKQGLPPILRPEIE